MKTEIKIGTTAANQFKCPLSDNSTFRTLYYMNTPTNVQRHIYKNGHYNTVKKEKNLSTQNIP